MSTPLRRLAGRRTAIALLGLAAGGLGAAQALGQRVDTDRARTLVVGPAGGPAPVERIDAARSGASRVPLPVGTLHVAWRRNLGFAVDSGPLVGSNGDIVVIGASGKVVVLAPDGEERSHTVLGAAATSPGALGSDGTLAVMTSQGDVVAVQHDAVRFRTRLEGGRSNVAPLALDDGGFVVVSPAEIVALDADGNIRARARVDAGTPADALLAARTADGPRVYEVMSGTGDVYAWYPAAGAEPSRVGTFGGDPDGGAALMDDGSLLAIVDGARLVSLDPRRGTRVVRASSTSTGTVRLLGPPSTRVAGVAILAATPTRTLALTFDPTGAEASRQTLGVSILPASADGGASASVAPAHSGPLIDAHGDLAFALPSGDVGVLSSTGSRDVLDDVCSRFSSHAVTLARPNPSLAGFAPAAPSALVVACTGGVVARVDSDFARSPARSR